MKIISAFVCNKNLLHIQSENKNIYEQWTILLDHLKSSKLDLLKEKLEEREYTEEDFLDDINDQSEFTDELGEDEHDNN